MIYLASPYSHDDPEVRQDRFIKACRAAAWLIRAGHIVFSPIAMNHPIAIHGGLSGDWESWEKSCLLMVDACDELVVLMIPGWEVSKGVIAEKNYAHAAHKGTRLLEPCNFGEFRWV